MTDATDRSMLRVSITSICPTATIIRSAASIAIAVRLSPLDHARIDQSHRNHDRRHGADEADLALRDDATGEGDDAVALVRRRLVATASLDRGGVGVRIRRCADDPFSVRLGSRESRGLAPLAQDDDPIAHADELGQLRRNRA